MTNTVAIATTKSTKRNRTYLAPNRNEVLAALELSKDGKTRIPLTLAEVSARIGLTIESPYALLLEKQGLIVRKGVVRGKPGRPPVLWTVTDKGSKRAKRALKG